MPNVKQVKVECLTIFENHLNTDEKAKCFEELNRLGWDKRDMKVELGTVDVDETAFLSENEYQAFTEKYKKLATHQHQTSKPDWLWT